MIQTPKKQVAIPKTAFEFNFSPLKYIIITIQIGKIAPRIAPNPLLIYLIPQVLNPLLKTKFSILKIRIVRH